DRRGSPALAGTVRGAGAAGAGRQAGAGPAVPVAARRADESATVLAWHQAAGAGGRDRAGQGHTAWSSTRLRHASAEPRGRSACAAVAAGPQQPVDHADLYRSGQGTPATPASAASPARLTGRDVVGIAGD